MSREHTGFGKAWGQVYGGEGRKDFWTCGKREDDEMSGWAGDKPFIGLGSLDKPGIPLELEPIALERLVSTRIGDARVVVVGVDSARDASLGAALEVNRGMTVSMTVVDEVLLPAPGPLMMDKELYSSASPKKRRKMHGGDSLVHKRAWLKGEAQGKPWHKAVAYCNASNTSSMVVTTTDDVGKVTCLSCISIMEGRG